MAIRKNLTLLLICVLQISTSLAQQPVTQLEVNGVSFRLPGKWKEIGYRKESDQHSLLNENIRVNIGISARDPKPFEFYHNGLDGYDLVNAYYDWDSKYWSTGQNVTIDKIVADTLNKIIIWSLLTPQGENVLLFGLKSGKLISVSLNNSDEKKKMSRQTAVRFLKDIMVK